MRLSIHIDTRRKIKKIPDLKGFDDLLERSTLDDVDKQILRLHYLKKKSLGYIGDTLGYTEGAIKKRHLKALDKLNKLL